MDPTILGYPIGLAQPNDSGFIRCSCPFHTDTNPSAAYHEKSLVFSCPVCGNYSPTKFVATVNGIELDEARVILNDFRFRNGYKIEIVTEGETKSPVFNPSWTNILDALSYDGDLLDEYAKSRGLTRQTLEAYNVGEYEDSVVFPYRVDDKTYAIRYRREGQKLSEKGSCYIPFGLHLVGDSKVVFLVEGESDTLRVYQEFQIPTIGTPGGEFKPEWARLVQDIEKFIVIPQDDNVGDKFLASCKKVLGEGRVVVQELKWSRTQVGKDFCDWCFNNEQGLAKLNESIGHLILRLGSSKGPRIINGYELESQAILDQENLTPIISNLLCPGDLGVVVGGPKSHKTWFTLNILRSLMYTKGNFLDMDQFELDPNFELNCLYFLLDRFSTVNWHDRLQHVFKGCEGWQDCIHTAMQEYCKLEDKGYVDEIAELINEHGFNVFVIDPWQKAHSKRESGEEDMKVVLDHVNYLQALFPELVILINHHTPKNVDINRTWDNLRGTSRLGGEASLGFFLDKNTKGGEQSFDLIVDGRNIEPPVNKQGGHILNLKMNESGIFVTERDRKVINIEGVLLYLKEFPNGVDQEVLCKYLGISIKTLNRWCTKYPDKLERSKPSPGNPVRVVLKS